MADKTNGSRMLLFQASLLRIIFTLGVLYCFQMPFFLKILLIMTFIDNIDCKLLRKKNPELSSSVCQTLLYQKIGKITDSVCYIILMGYILYHKLLSDDDMYLLVGLLIFRLIGTALFLKSNNRKYLFYFPNFFLDFSLGLFVIQHFSLFKYKLIILLGIFMYKIIHEYIQHYNKSIRLNFLRLFEKYLPRVEGTIKFKDG